MAIQQYIIDRINALDLKDPKVFKNAQDKYYGTIISAIQGWGGKKPTVELIEKAMVLGAKLECAKNGKNDISIVVIYDENSAPAFVKHNDNSKIFLNFGNKSFMHIIEDIGYVYDITKTKDEETHKNAAKEIFLFSVVHDTITHEIEHLRQHKDSLRNVDNPGYKEIFIERYVRKGFNGVGNDFYKKGGHDEFQTEIAANIAGQLRREEFVREFLEFLGKTAKEEGFTPAQLKEIKIELDDIYNQYNNYFGGKENNESIDKNIEILFKRAGYTLDEMGEIINKGSTITIVDVILDRYNEANLLQEYFADGIFRAPDHKWVPKTGATPEEEESIKQGFKELAEFQKELREGNY